MVRAAAVFASEEAVACPRQEFAIMLDAHGQAAAGLVACSRVQIVQFGVGRLPSQNAWDGLAPHSLICGHQSPATRVPGS